MELKPGSLARYPGLNDTNPGHSKYLPGDCEAQPGIFPVPAFEDQFLFIISDTNTIILEYYPQFPVFPFLAVYLDQGGWSAVPQRIFQQVVDHFFGEWIGIDVDRFNTGSYLHSFVREVVDSPTDHRPEGLPDRFVYAYIFVLAGKPKMTGDLLNYLEACCEVRKTDGISFPFFKQCQVPVKGCDKVADIMTGQLT